MEGVRAGAVQCVCECECLSVLAKSCAVIARLA